METRTSWRRVALDTDTDTDTDVGRFVAWVRTVNEAA